MYSISIDHMVPSLHKESVSDVRSHRGPILGLLLFSLYILLFLFLCNDVYFGFILVFSASALLFTEHHTAVSAGVLSLSGSVQVHSILDQTGSSSLGKLGLFLFIYSHWVQFSTYKVQIQSKILDPYILY